jgi:hypothetical protein
MRKSIIKMAVFSFLVSLFNMKSNAQTLDWKIQNTGPSRYLENVEPNLLYFSIYANNKKRFTIREEPNSQFPILGNLRYAVFLSEDMNGFFDKTPFRNYSTATSSLHSQNKTSSSFAGSTFQDYDWGQNIISNVKREKTVSFVVNHNGFDASYCGGDGKHVAQSYWSRSDISLKENISTIDNALNKVKQLRGVYFTYKPQALCSGCDTSTTTIDNDLSKQMGLIAQEVEAVVPEVVRDQYTGHKAVAYQHLVGLLIEAIKEQQIKIDAQALQTQQLKQEITDLVGRTVYTDVDKTKLYQNDPNPFRGVTTITYFIDENVSIVNAEIEIRNMMGILQTTVPLGDRSGLGRVNFDGSGLSEGYYVYSLKLNGSLKDSKMLLIGE